MAGLIDLTQNQPTNSLYAQPGGFGISSSAPAEGGLTAAAPAVATTAAKSVLSTVPWLGVLNVGAGIYSAWATYKAAKKQAEDSERAYQENKRRWDMSFGAEREDARRNLLLSERNRKDAIQQLWQAKMKFSMYEKPVLQEKLRTMKMAKSNPRAAALRQSLIPQM